MERTDTEELRCLRFEDLKRNRIVKNRMTLSRWIKAGKFPAPIRLGDNSVAWRWTEVKEWLESRDRAGASQ